MDVEEGVEDIFLQGLLCQLSVLAFCNAVPPNTTHKALQATCREIKRKVERHNVLPAQPKPLWQVPQVIRCLSGSLACLLC
jgi:hypothetical protein